MIAPEVLEGKAGHSYEVDIWSLGVIIYTLIIGKPPFETSDVKTTYKRIRMNAYNFPDHVIISEGARDLITKILNSDPKLRPTLDEILQHEFLNNPGGSIPKTLPQSFLACPPSAQYIRQYMPQGFNSTGQALVKGIAPSQRLESTAPVNPATRNGLIPSTQGAGSLNYQGTGQRQSMQTPLQQPYQSGANPLTLSDRGLGVLDAKRNIQSQGALSAAKDQQQSYATSKQGTILSPKGSMINTHNPMMMSQAPVLPGADTQRMMKEAAFSAPQCWVKKWVDYSSKYGLGYLLSNGATGVFFNDSTKILLESSSQQSFYYYERKAVSATEKQDVMQMHDMANYPKELHKKVTLMQHFRSYLENHEESQDGGSSKAPETPLSSVNPGTPQSTPGTTPLVYVKKWMRTKHAIMFRLSNKIVQVNFQDHTEILLNSESRLVTYVNKKGERSTLPLSHALESNNAEMTKRLKYTKDILTHMLNNNNALATGGSTSAKGGAPQMAVAGVAMQATYQSSSRGSGLSSKRTLISQGGVPAQEPGAHLRPISTSSKPTIPTQTDVILNRRPHSLLGSGVQH